MPNGRPIFEKDITTVLILAGRQFFGARYLTPGRSRARRIRKLREFRRNAIIRAITTSMPRNSTGTTPSLAHRLFEELSRIKLKITFYDWREPFKLKQPLKIRSIYPASLSFERSISKLENPESNDPRRGRINEQMDWKSLRYRTELELPLLKLDSTFRREFYDVHFRKKLLYRNFIRISIYLYI